MAVAMISALTHSSLDFIPGQESVLSYLPLAHIAERGLYLSVFYYGGKIGIFSSSDKKELSKALAIV